MQAVREVMSPTTSEGHRDDSDGALVHMKAEERRRLRLRATLRRARLDVEVSGSMNDLHSSPRPSGSDRDQELRHTWLATFTDGAYTVTSTGPARTFIEASAAHAVRHAVWVRALPAPFDGHVDTAWLTRALAANRKAALDVLALAMQYIAGKAPLFEGGLQIAGDASYGVLKDGEREEGSDFNDYLGIEWKYPRRWTSRSDGSIFASIAQGSSAWSGATAATRRAPGAGKRSRSAWIPAGP